METADRLIGRSWAQPSRKRAGSRFFHPGAAARCAVLLCSGVVSSLSAQTLESGYLFAGPTFVNRLDGAGHVGGGLDFRLAPHVGLGGEIGALFKNDVGILASANLSYHFSTPEHGWDPFVTAGVSGARISGRGGFYFNLGGGVNYWVSNHWALRGEFKAYPGGQSLGSFAELRFGVTLR